MKFVFQTYPVKCLQVILSIAILSVNTMQAQICPQPVTTTITSNPSANSNTYYPGIQAIVSAGSLHARCNQSTNT
jgi:hypothetical protein